MSIRFADLQSHCGFMGGLARRLAPPVKMQECKPGTVGPRFDTQRSHRGCGGQVLAGAGTGLDQH